MLKLEAKRYSLLSIFSNFPINNFKNYYHLNKKKNVKSIRQGKRVYHGVGV